MLRDFGYLSFTDVSGQNIGSMFKGQAFQLPRTCLCRRIIAKGKTTALDRDQDERMSSERIWGKMKIQNWCKMTMDREACKRSIEQADTRKEL